MPDNPVIRTPVPGPWGPFHLAATERGVVAVAWLTTEPAFDAELGEAPPRPDRERPRHPTGRPAADPPRRWPGLARGPARGASDPALRRLRPGRPAGLGPARPRGRGEIPWGRTASYGEIARQVGAPRAARAVGGAVGRNPVSLLIPCHRVIAADGGIGGYGGDGWGSREERLAISGICSGAKGSRSPPPTARLRATPAGGVAQEDR